jgi:hypothetical protein
MTCEFRFGAPILGDWGSRVQISALRPKIYQQIKGFDLFLNSQLVRNSENKRSLFAPRDA